MSRRALPGRGIAASRRAVLEKLQRYLDITAGSSGGLDFAEERHYGAVGDPRDLLEAATVRHELS